MRPRQRSIRRNQNKKQTENPKWQAKAEKVLPLFENKPELRKTVLLFNTRSYWHWTALEETSKGSGRTLEQKGVIHLLPDKKTYARTTVGKILLRKFLETEA